MRTTTAFLLATASVVAAFAVMTIPDWQAPVAGTQIGADASGMVQLDSASPWRVAAAPKTALAPAEEGGPAATAIYTDVQVLTDVSAAEFMRLQTAMTAWIAPKAGCAFCHAGQDFVSNANPMKEAAREMLRMTRRINTAWHEHAGEGGVTCFSCHRGEPVPPETWFPSRPKGARSSVAQSENWDETADTVRKFFPDNGWSLYLLHDEPIRGEAKTILREGTAPSQVETKRIYEMMMQMSDGIGVNCGYCHNSRTFSDWSQSPKARSVAHDAIRMMRDVNRNYLAGQAAILAQTRDLVKQNDLVMPPFARAPQDGAGLAVCATCHYGRIHPDSGAATIGNYGALASALHAEPTRPAAATPVIPQTTAPE